MKEQNHGLAAALGLSQALALSEKSPSSEAPAPLMLLLHAVDEAFSTDTPTDSCSRRRDLAAREKASESSRVERL